MQKLGLIGAVALSLTLGGCFGSRHPEATGAVVGGAAGALVGGVATGTFTGAAVGGAVGAGAGALIGHVTKRRW
jgi:hypothetical protein